jgi:hypothetical protein
MGILLKESNVISLRTADVYDGGNLVSFTLNPADLSLLVPKGRTWWAPKDFDWVSQDTVWIYRHMRSASDELKLKHEFPCVDQDIMPIKFNTPPEFKLLWADSGHSVALFLNGEPWAFIHEDTHRGYSKGIIKPGADKAWDQALFERTFLEP